MSELPKEFSIAPGGDFVLPFDIAKAGVRGRLVRLDIESDSDLVYPFHSLYRSDAPPGPAAYWLMERLSQS